MALYATRNFKANGIQVNAGEIVPLSVPAGHVEACLRTGWIVERVAPPAKEELPKVDEASKQEPTKPAAPKRPTK